MQVSGEVQVRGNAGQGEGPCWPPGGWRWAGATPHTAVRGALMSLQPQGWTHSLQGPL